LRVDVGRLRRALRALADVSATRQGFALSPRRARDVVVLARPVDEEHAPVLAFLADGESWSSSALALALGRSQRTVQRALDALRRREGAGVRPRARAPVGDPSRAGFTTTLLLPARCRVTRMAHERSRAEIVREYGPFPGVDACTESPTTARTSGSRPAPAERARSGEREDAALDRRRRARRNLFDGEHLFQIAEDRIQKIDPRRAACSPRSRRRRRRRLGARVGRGTLWVGQYRERKIHQVDPETGAVLRTIESNRFVTGVTWVDGELWHATWEARERPAPRRSRDGRSPGDGRDAARRGRLRAGVGRRRPVLLRWRHEREGQGRATAPATLRSTKP
jgi:hypothetical protein